MTADWWEVVIGLVGVAVAIVVAWVAARGERAARLGRRAQLAFELAQQLRELQREPSETGKLIPATEDRHRDLASEMEDAGKFVASEYSRMLLRAGWAFEAILVTVSYGLVLTGVGVARLADTSGDHEANRIAGAGLLTLGALFVIIGLFALATRAGRTERQRGAGISVPSVTSEFTQVWHWWRNRRIMKIQAGKLVVPPPPDGGRRGQG